jgi:hypothetical protein
MDKPKVSVTFKMLEVPDSDPDLSYLEQDYAGEKDAATHRAQDAERLAAYNRGEWQMIGIRARATIIVQRGNYGTIYHIESPGLWGIESDSDPRYFKEVYEEECDRLREDIAALGEWKGGAT